MPEPWLPNPAPYPSVPPTEWPAPLPVASTPAPLPPPDEPRGDRARAFAVVVGAGLVAILVAVSAIALLRPRTHAVGAATPTTSSASGPSTTLPSMTDAELQAELRSLADYVADQRGLQFTRRPAARILSSSSFDQRRSDELDARFGAVVDRLTDPFRALHLVQGDTPLRSLMHTWLADDEVAFYDVDTGEILVREGGLSDYVRYRLVQSLTEELDFQHFGLDAIAHPSALGDAQFAQRTLLAGDVLDVSSSWGGTLPPHDQRALVDEIDAHQPGHASSGDEPEGLRDLLSDPWMYGPTLWNAVRHLGGTDPLDRAFRQPPAGSAQAIDTRRYVAGDVDVAVPAPLPDDGAKATASGRFGWLLLRVATQDHVSSDVLSAALVTYRGDALVAWRDGDDSCARLRVAADDADGVATLKTLFTQWTSDVGGTVKLVPDAARPGIDLVEVRMCSSGQAAPDSLPNDSGGDSDGGPGI